MRSFSAVATTEVKKEAALMAFSIRRLYDCPIFLTCDQETQDFIAPLVTGIDFNTIINPLLLDGVNKDYADIKRHNNFHRVDCIALKMDCLGDAIAKYGSTMFLDTDIILLREIDNSGDHELALSPHRTYANKAENHRKYGVFNAGYLWARRGQVADVWRDIYRNRSEFFEQQGMIWLLEHFETKLFDKDHNIGFWRLPLRNFGGLPPAIDPSVVDWTSAVSLHSHMFTQCYTKADPGLKSVYNQYREFARELLPCDIKEFINIL